jgi:hypothetical protein
MSCGDYLRRIKKLPARKSVDGTADNADGRRWGASRDWLQSRAGEIVDRFFYFREGPS